jgi:hypothetical protein
VNVIIYLQARKRRCALYGVPIYDPSDNTEVLQILHGSPSLFYVTEGG